MRYSKKYTEKIINDPLPPLPEDERIYLNVQYNKKGFAKIANCGFDAERKLWFTGSRNTYIKALVDLYGINESTSKKALQLLKERLEKI